MVEQHLVTDKALPIKDCQISSFQHDIMMIIKNLISAVQIQAPSVSANFKSNKHRKINRHKEESRCVIR